MQIRFQNRLWPLIATLILVVSGIALAQWQSRRAIEKETIFKAIQAASQAPLREVMASSLQELPPAYSRIKLRGEFMRNQDIYLDNRPLAQQAGYQILTPFRISQTDQYVMVLRGWHSRDARDRTKLYKLPAMAGEIEIQGMILPHLQRVMQLATDGPVKAGELRQNLVLGQVAQQLGIQLQPFILAQENTPASGLRDVVVVPENQADKHRGYAFQWYGLSFMALLFYFVTGIRRASSSNSNS